MILTNTDDILRAQGCQLGQQRDLCLVKTCWRLHAQVHVQITTATPSKASRTEPSQSQDLTGLGARAHIYRLLPIKCVEADRGA